MRIIDLSMGIEPHWRWSLTIKQGAGYIHRGTQIGHGEMQHGGPDTTIRQMGTHIFTHCDAPLHNIPDTPTIDEMPIEKFFGDAAVIDISYKREREAVTADDLEKNGRHAKEGDIALMKSRWDEKRSYKTKEYWTDAPFYSLDACHWFAQRKVKSIASDFPFLGIERHSILFRNGIGNMEYLCNVGQVKKERVKLYAVPIKVINAHGAPCRAFAVEE